MTLQQLQYIVALDVHRHFVKASQSCHVAQPTLTLQVKKLEEEISTVLFDRTSQPLKPTPIGEVFIERAKRIINDVQELKNLINEDKNNIEGEFRMGIIPTLAPNLLPLFINDFISKHPKTKIIIEELQSEKIIEQLCNKDLEIGLLSTPLNEPDIREEPIFHEPFLIYTNEGNELLKKKEIISKQLKPKGLWLLRKGHCFRNQTLNVCDFDFSEQHRNIIMEGGSIETLKKMVKKVNGYTLIPELSFEEKLDMNNVAHFSEPKPVREIGLVVHKHFTREILIEELKKSILRNTPASFRKNTKLKKVKWR
ncbi:MAG: hydrogen peroxide-inducible genes activator [Bacteroidota bacterium]